MDISLPVLLFPQLAERPLFDHFGPSNSSMIYPKGNLIIGMMTLLGTHPIHEHKKRNWVEKIDVVGATLCCVQVALTFYTFVLEQKSGAFSSNFSNNILWGSVILKKTLAVGLPLFTVCIKFMNIRGMELLYEKMELFDVFIETSELKMPNQEFLRRQNELEPMTRKMNFVSGMLVILMECFNIITAISYMIVSRGSVPRIETLYFYHSSITIFITHSFHIFTKLFGLKLRHELFNAFVQGLLEEQWTTERQEREKKMEYLQILVEKKNGALN